MTAPSQSSETSSPPATAEQPAAQLPKPLRRGSLPPRQSPVQQALLEVQSTLAASDPALSFGPAGNRDAHGAMNFGLGVRDSAGKLRLFHQLALTGSEQIDLQRVRQFQKMLTETEPKLIPPLVENGIEKASHMLLSRGSANDTALHTALVEARKEGLDLIHLGSDRPNALPVNTYAITFRGKRLDADSFSLTDAQGENPDAYAIAIAALKQLTRQALDERRRTDQPPPPPSPFVPPPPEPHPPAPAENHNHDGPAPKTLNEVVSQARRALGRDAAYIDIRCTEDAANVRYSFVTRPQQVGGYSFPETRFPVHVQLPRSVSPELQLQSTLAALPQLPYVSHPTDDTHVRMFFPRIGKGPDTEVTKLLDSLQDRGLELRHDGNYRFQLYRDGKPLDQTRYTLTHDGAPDYERLIGRLRTIQ